ncbi:hypothetical protein [Lichenicola sp.]|uniref:hypothetical protein n=1 Tax=Lichenicola sp. TaxID=2804529 RepID=UPI003AFFC54A
MSASRTQQFVTLESYVLFGTEEIPDPVIQLSAGPLTATLQDGNLRHIRIAGHELIRAIACVVRDHEWGTVACRISDLSVEQQPERFLVRYQADCREGEQSYRYQVRIEGGPDHVVFSMQGEALTDFNTARLGFVVLHPIAGTSGQPVTVLHTDGTEEAATFPELIAPYQPFSDIRALTHEPLPGVVVTCRMEGDAFEMEDQRNWTDASYKTYVRPIGLPWPYLLRAGEIMQQSVALTVSGIPADASSGGSGRVTVAEEPVQVTIGQSSGRLPALGLHLEPDDALSSAELDQLRALGPEYLLVRHDPRRHGVARLELAAGIARAVGAELHLEAVLPGLALEAEARALADALRQADAAVTTIVALPAADLKGTLPGSTWPDCPPLEAVYAAVRAALPRVRLAGGTPNFFTELNRKRPPTAQLDLVAFSTSAIVHAADDITVMENLAALPAVLASASRIAGGRPLYLGPSHIGARDNPYGVAAAPNPDNVRKAMTATDPRQRGNFAAAWAVGYLARCAGTDIAAVTLSAPVGPFGVLHRDGPLAAPHVRHGDPYPIHGVLQRIAGAARAETLSAVSSDPDRLAALAWMTATHTELLLANLTSRSLSAAFDGSTVTLAPYATHHHSVRRSGSA